LPKQVLVLFIITILVVSSAFAAPDPSPPREDAAARAALQSYLEAAPSTAKWMRDVSMEMNMDASLPRLNKTGKLRALRHISNIGKITYRILSFQGDNTVKKDVIGKYLEAEAKATGGPSIGINHANYKFKYWGVYGSEDWQLYLFELQPRAKRLGLFRGWLWIHAATGLPVREQGELVKNPSIFLRKVSFVRDYELRDGVAIPKSIESSIDTRVVGRAELSIKFSNVSKEDRRLASLSGNAASAASQ
jgi:hypothetical protein